MTAHNKKTSTLNNHGLYRRIFFKMLAFLTILLSLPAAAWSFFVNHFPVRTVEKDTFQFDPVTGFIHWKLTNKDEPYKLVITGLVKQSKTFTYKELNDFPQINQVSDFHCVEGWSVKDVGWGGFRFQEIVKRVVLKKNAHYVLFHAIGETSSKPYGQKYYVESFPLKELLDPAKECLLALTMDGKPLSHDHGAPLRVVAPYDLGYKSIKYVKEIEFIEKPEAGWWTLANPIYSINAPVPPERLRKK
jgi:DMSO/TMAO reductase YedYZ molybdopterin-dependent catalytic subunit